MTMTADEVMASAGDPEERSEMEDAKGVLARLAGGWAGRLETDPRRCVRGGLSCLADDAAGASMTVMDSPD